MGSPLIQVDNKTDERRIFSVHPERLCHCDNIKVTCSPLFRDRTEFFVNFTRNMIKQRRQNPPKEKLHDMLELLLEITDAVNDDEAGHEATRDWAGGRPKKSYPLTEFEIARILLQVS